LFSQFFIAVLFCVFGKIKLKVGLNVRDGAIGSMKGMGMGKISVFDSENDTTSNRKQLNLVPNKTRPL
jgi:hypothetical protein